MIIYDPETETADAKAYREACIWADSTNADRFYALKPDEKLAFDPYTAEVKIVKKGV